MSKYQQAIEAFDEYRQIVESWNAQADAYNQWDTLDDQEKIEWALAHARSGEAVEYQVRFQTKFGTSANWSPWEKCGKEEFEVYKRHVILHDRVHETRELFTHSQPMPVDDLPTLVKRLAQALRKAAPDNDLTEKALDYLKRKSLGENILRDDSQPEQPVHSAFLVNLARSRQKHPGTKKMFDGLLGELHELKRAYAGDGDIRAEAFDVAVCAYRIATEGDEGGNEKIEYIPDCMAWGSVLPEQPIGWIRAIDEELVSLHLGIADPNDSYEAAKKKLTDLVQWHVDVASDPTMNSGFSFQPVQPLQHIDTAQIVFTDIKLPDSTPGNRHIFSCHSRENAQVEQQSATRTNEHSIGVLQRVRREIESLTTLQNGTVDHIVTSACGTIDRLVHALTLQRAEQIKQSWPQWKQDYEVTKTPATQVNEQLNKVALVAHHGGLVGLSESDALILIRRLTIQHHNWKQTIKETKAALNALAAEAARGQ